MKQIKIVSLLLMATIVSFTGFGQVFPAKTVPSNQSTTARGNYGTYSAIGYTTGQICTIASGTVTPMPSSRAADTLKSPVVNATGYGTDTGYVQFSYSSKTDKLYDLKVTVISGTLAGTAVLQGSTDGVNWYTLTGITTYCSGCVGASASLSGAGTSDYQWSFIAGSDIYPYHQIRAITSGTCTATFTASQGTAY
jgi:hypothetical protein